MNFYLDSYLNNNLGDDLMIDMLCQRYPEHDFYIGDSNCLSECAITCKNLHIIRPIIPTEKQIVLRCINKLISCFGIPKIQIIMMFRIRPFDGVLVVGGSIFKQITKCSWKNKIRDAKYIIIHSSTNIVVNCNFGPYQSHEFLSEHQKLFRLYDCITFRDCHSYELFRQLNNAKYFPDMVFSREFESHPCGIIGISVINKYNRGVIKNKDIYISGIVELVQRLSKNHAVRLFSFCSNEGDNETCREIASLSSAENVEIYEHKSLEETLKALSELSGFVCTRFHANVIAIKMRIPFVPVVYERKTSDMLDDFNDNLYRWNIKDGERLNIEEALSALKHFPNYPESYIKKSRGHLDILDSFLKISPRVQRT